MQDSSDTCVDRTCPAVKALIALVLLASRCHSPKEKNSVYTVQRASNRVQRIFGLLAKDHVQPTTTYWHGYRVPQVQSRIRLKTTTPPPPGPTPPTFASVLSATYRMLLSLLARNRPSMLTAITRRPPMVSMPMIVATASYSMAQPALRPPSTEAATWARMSVIASLASALPRPGFREGVIRKKMSRDTDEWGGGACVSRE